MREFVAKTALYQSENCLTVARDVPHKPADKTKLWVRVLIGNRSSDFDRAREL
jgi:hypothetical protein